MRLKLLIAALSGLIVAGCGESRSFQTVDTGNPVFIDNTIFDNSENISDSKFAALKSKYQLDSIFHSEKDELKKILLLRHWIHEKMKIDDYGPYAGNGSVENTLDEALKGNGFHCGFFSSVQNAVLNAYGYVTRSILADTGEPVDYMVGGGHHALNEVWLNCYQKWFLSDAKYDYHFEKNGIPLSAFEVREEYLKNKAADIDLVKGMERKKISGLPEYNIPSREQLARVYTWVSWYKDNDRYTHWPENSADIIIYQDEYTRTHTWLWDGKPLWAYNTKFMHLVSDRSKIEWTPNTISSKVLIQGNKARISLTSATPNLKTYQMKEIPDEEWKNTSDTVEIDLKDDNNEMMFRTENLAGVTGPEHKVIIAK